MQFFLAKDRHLISAISLLLVSIHDVKCCRVLAGIQRMNALLTLGCSRPTGLAMGNFHQG
jgi:hypothetical protein